MRAIKLFFKYVIILVVFTLFAHVIYSQEKAPEVTDTEKIKLNDSKGYLSKLLSRSNTVNKLALDINVAKKNADGDIVSENLTLNDVRSVEAFDFYNYLNLPLYNQIRLEWIWEKDPDIDRKGILLIRRKGSLPNKKLLVNGVNYNGPEITTETGEGNRKYISGDLAFSTKTKLTNKVSEGSLLSLPLTAIDEIITHPDFKDLPTPPFGGKCNLLISAGSNGDNSEIVSYATVGESLTVKRGELNSIAVVHSRNASVSFLPPRPISIANFLIESLPSSNTSVQIIVDKTIGLDGYPAIGIIRIGDEVMEYDNINFGATVDTLNIIKRGLNNTNVTKHSVGSTLFWSNHPTYTADTISVLSTEGFPVSGRLKIDNEEMWYNSKTATSFNGVVRGIFSDDAYMADTIVVAHQKGINVIDSLNKVIMNDSDLDGPNDLNNDHTEDSIAFSWTDKLYYGEEATAYFYSLFTYDDKLNYSNGKSVKIYDMKIKQYGRSNDTNRFSYNVVNLGNKIYANGGDELFFSVVGGLSNFTWTATTPGLTIDAAPKDFDTKGELTRYVSYSVPQCLEYPGKDIVITVTDSSTNQLILSITIFVDSYCFLTNKNYLNVTSDIGSPIVNTNVNTTVTISVGDRITFLVGLPASSDKSSIVWGSPGPNTFGGIAILSPEMPDKLIYIASNPANPTLTTGTDVIAVTDGINTIEITIIIGYWGIIESCLFCCHDKPLSVLPGSDGSVAVSPGGSFSFQAFGGTCQFTWSIIVNNSGATIIRTDNVHATYTAGGIPSTVDIIELSDGVSTKQVEIHVSKSGSGSIVSGCFLRKKKSSRD